MSYSCTAATLRKYGPQQTWDGRIEKIDTQTGKMQFAVLKDGKQWGNFSSIMIGEHNLYNQVAIAAALDFYGITPEELAIGFDSLARGRRTVG